MTKKPGAVSSTCTSLSDALPNHIQGPLDFESPPPGTVLTRRFRLEQTSFDVNVGSVKKVQAIDDCTESLVSHTNSSSETINPHGVDMILAAAAYRVRRGRKLG